MVNLEGLREAITRAGQGQLGCRCPASEDPIRRNMTKRYIFAPVACFLLNFSILTAQNWTEMSGRVSPYVTRLDGERLTCGRATQEEMTSIRGALDRMSPRTPPSGKYALAPPAANIVVNYSGFTPEAKAAFQRAVDIWSALLIATVPIEIAAVFGEEESLGSARPHTFYSDSSSSVWRPISLWNQLRARDALPDKPDIEVTMSDSKDWYYGLDGNPGEDQFDFISVVLHEIGHGLGFTGSFSIDAETEEADYGFRANSGLRKNEILPMIFDARIFSLQKTGNTENPKYEWKRLVDEDEFSNPSTELAEAITGIKLFWYGLETAEANGGNRPVLLWAPKEHSRSSVAHLDYDAYPPGTPNELMNPFMGKEMSIHEPGPILLAMLSDMGWTIREQTLQIPHFGAGNGVGSDLVVTNLSSTDTAEIRIDAWDPNGDALDGHLLFGNNRFRIHPLGSRTLTADESSFQTGSVTVSSNVPVSAIIRFDIRGIGVAGVGTSPEFRIAIAPVRRIGNLSTGIAVRNVELSAQTVELILKDKSGYTVRGGRADREIEAGGRIAEFIQEIFPDADTVDFRGEISINAMAGKVAAMALELDTGGVFTTLPVNPID